MTILKVTLQSESSIAGKNQYINKVNADDYKQLATILSDLANHGKPVDKAIKHFYLLKKSDWESVIGL